MTEPDYAALLNRLQLENQNLRRTIGRQAAEITELKDAAEIRKWLELKLNGDGK